MAARPILTGLKFDRLYVNGFLEVRKGQRIWSCTCDCGAIVDASTGELLRGEKRSCGCLHKEVTAARMRTHGKSKSTEYVIWDHMRDRCLNPSDPAYANYGGRGVSVCSRWAASFENFLADMGERPDGMTLDRMDNDGPYSPENCRWATRKEQNRNRRDNRMVVVGGVEATLAEHCERTGIPYGRALYRLKAGYAPDAALAEGSLRTKAAQDLRSKA